MHNTQIDIVYYMVFNISIFLYMRNTQIDTVYFVLTQNFKWILIK